MHATLTVSKAAALLDAVRSGVPAIEVKGRIDDLESFALRPGQALIGGDIRFAPGQDGVGLSSDNRLSGIKLRTDPDRRAVWNLTDIASMGTLTLRDVETTGQVQIVAAGSLRKGHVHIDGLDIKAADTRAATPRPAGYGVEVLLGALTVYNQHSDRKVVITASITGVSVGRKSAPVRGSGVFVSGGGDDGGRLRISRLETGDVFSDGGLADDVADTITGGVFTVYGCQVELVVNGGITSTFGHNDMVLDNWGDVARWEARGPVQSTGSSGIGFVNFGTIGQLICREAVITRGTGARGFNVYAGSIKSAEFRRIETHGDGAIGVQVSRPLGRLVVHEGIETNGASGKSLVKGKVLTLRAVGLSIRPGATVDDIDIRGGITVRGENFGPTELLGRIGRVSIDRLSAPKASDKAITSQEHA